METIKCKSCGAVQEVSNENSTCSFCGSGIEIKQSKEFYTQVAKGEFGNFLIMAETAEEATNYDEAMNYYNRILEKDTTYADAWLGKGNCTIYSSKIGDIKMKEGLTYWKNAIKFAEYKEPMQLRVSKEINNVVQTFFPNLLNHYSQFAGLDDSYAELASRFLILEGGIDYTCQLCPDEAEFFQTGYDLCEKVITAPGAGAGAAQGAAAASAIFNTLAGNKYSAQSNQADYQKASERKKQIQNFSNQINHVKNKYLEGLIRLGVITENDAEKNKSNVTANKEDPQIKQLKTEFYISFAILAGLIILFSVQDQQDGLPGIIVIWILYYFFSLNKRSKKRFGVPFHDLSKIK